MNRRLKKLLAALQFLAILGLVAWTAAQPGSPVVSLAEPVHTLSHPQAVGLAYSPDGAFLATWSSYRIKLWTLPVYEAAEELTAPHLWMGIGTADFSADGRLLVSSTGADLLRIWEVATGEVVSTLNVDQLGPSTRVAMSPAGDSLAYVDEDTVVLLDLVSSGTIARFRGHEEGVTALAWHPEGGILASGGMQGAVRLWHVDAGFRRQIIAEQAGVAVYAVAFNGDGSLLAVGFEDGVVRLWDMSNGDEIARLDGHVDAVNDIAFNPADTMLASSSNDETVRFWDLETGRQVAVLDLWEVIEPEEIADLPDPRRFARAYAVDFSVDGTHLAVTYCSTHLCEAHVWDLASILKD